MLLMILRWVIFRRQITVTTVSLWRKQTELNPKMWFNETVIQEEKRMESVWTTFVNISTEVVVGCDAEVNEGLLHLFPFFSDGDGS